MKYNCCVSFFVQYICLKHSDIDSTLQTKIRSVSTLWGLLNVLVKKASSWWMAHALVKPIVFHTYDITDIQAFLIMFHSNKTINYI